jgi:pyruvate dehydrogenase E1 component alpha subunit
MLEGRLLATGSLSQADIRAMDAGIAAEVAEAFAFAEASPFPDPDDAYQDLYRAEREA